MRNLREYLVVNIMVARMEHMIRRQKSYFSESCCVRLKQFWWWVVLEERESRVDLEANERQASKAAGWRLRQACLSHHLDLHPILVSICKSLQK